MGKGNEQTMEIVQYYMSLHFGICHGPLDYISGIYINEKTAWEGEQSVYGTISIDEQELFGGEKKEGGVYGRVDYLPGDDTQTIPELLAGLVEKTTATMPAYRGIASAWFYAAEEQLQNRDTMGFYWSANSPYLPGVWIKVARSSTDLNEEHARIYRADALVEASSRQVSGMTDADETGAARLVDISTSYLAFASEDRTEIIIQDVRTGDEYADFEIDYVPHWLYISESLGRLIVLGYDGTLRSYNLTGDLLDTAATGVDITVGGGALNGMPSEISVGGITYIFFMIHTNLVCCSNDGSGWATNWVESDWSVFSAGGIVAVSADYVVLKMNGGQIYRVPWTDVAMGAATQIDFSALLGWDTTTTHPVLSVTYVPSLGYWFFTSSGPLATLNSDLTVVVSSGSSGAGPSGSGSQHVKSHRMLIDDQIAAFIDDGNVYVHNVATCVQLNVYSLSEWGLATSDENDSGASSSEQALLLRRGENDHHILFLPSVGEFDSNPAHIIYECLLNTDWGMGASSNAIDFASFTAAAATLYAENFGLSMIWTKQSTIEAFISEVLDHIEATLFVSPRTGQLTLKLIRDDYSISGLPEFTPDNSVVTNFQRKLWGETVNEIVVSWTNPLNEETETVVAQDNANIAANGGIVSDSRNYYGVRVKDLGMRLAQRDLRAGSVPLASCDIEVNREGWDLLPGDVCILNSPEDGIENIIMRVGPVDYGKPGDPVVRASLVEDVWALALAEYTVPPDTLHEDQSEVPSAPDFTLVLTLPYYFMVRKLPAATLAEVDYPEVFAGILAAEDGQDTFEFELYGQGTDTLGNTTVVNLGSKTIVAHATLPEAFVAEVSTEFIFFTDRTKGNGPSVGGFMLIEGADETEHELCIFTAIETSSPQSYTVNRGVLDTIPRAWPIGTPVWFIDASSIFHDPTIRSEAEVVNYRILPRTSLGLLAYANAPVTTETLTARPHLPSRPAAVTIDLDDGFSGIINLVGVNPIPVAFARRNRETEDTIILAWDDGDVTPETGQTTTVRLLDLADNILHEYTGIAGTSQNVDPANFGSESEGYIEITAVRDGLESLQPYRVRVIVSGETFEFEDGSAYEFEDGEPKLFED